MHRASPGRATDTPPPRLKTEWRATVMPAGKQLSGFAAGTVIDTTDGPMPVEALMAGDMLLTTEGAPMPLRAVSSALCRNATVVRLALDTFERNGTARELLVGPAQTLKLDNGRPCSRSLGPALTPAAELICARGVRLEAVAEIRLYQLHCDARAVIHAQGVDAVIRPLCADLPAKTRLH